MTQKDIRDIAAYLFSDYECTRKTESGTIVGYSQSVVDLVANLDKWGLEYLNDNFLDIKLLLRPLSSLTDDEARTLASLLRPKSFTGSAEFDVERLEGFLRVYNWEGGYLEIGDDVPFSDLEDAAVMVAYLQSIHVYVPGTIDSNYVQLSDHA